MTKVLVWVCFLFMFWASAQKTEFINLDHDINDKNGLVKSLSIIDNRQNKDIGFIKDKHEDVYIHFKEENIVDYIPNWFIKHNKKIGNNDIILMLEELKVYDEQDSNKQYPYSKAKIKISGFLKRNDKYYFISRFNHIIVCNPKTTSHPGKYLAKQISEVILEFITTTYTVKVTGNYIPESGIFKYENYLVKNNKALFATELKNGVYTSFKNFSEQEPSQKHKIIKNKKGKVVRLLNENNNVAFSEMYCYVENGVGYKLTPVGFDEMKKDEKGFYIYTSRVNLFEDSKTNGAIIGAMSGGLVGALIGAAIESGTNLSNGAIRGLGYKTTLESNVYIDSLTGAYIFEK